VVPNHTSLKEIFEGAAPLIDNCFMDVDMNYNRDMPVPSAEHLAEILTDLYEDRDLLKQVGADCFQRATSAKYQWDNIAKQFEEAFETVLKPEEVEKPQIKRRKRKPKKELSMANQ
jgi:glycosyltransferase involved in cell wall biosynthesis